MFEKKKKKEFRRNSSCSHHIYNWKEKKSRKNEMKNCDQSVYETLLSKLLHYPIELQNFAIILLLEFILSLKSYEIKILNFKIGFTILS